MEAIMTTEHSLPPPYVVAVCQQKGGVAKTTTVSALATLLAQEGQDTMVVDLDPSANLTAGLGIEPIKVTRSVADILLGNERLATALMKTMVAGLDILPSNASMATVSRFLYLRPRFEYLLRNALAEAQTLGYTYVLIDCPPTLGALTATALTSADLAIIPTQCEYYSLQALEGVFKAVSNVRSRTNPSLRYRLLVTMFDQRGTLHTRVLEQIRERYGQGLFETVIGFDSKLRESQMVGKPIPLFAPNTRATQQYRLLAKELQTYAEKQSIPHTS
jgi:chromosome partitioning protein